MKKIRDLLQRIFRLGDWQAVSIFVTAIALSVIAVTKLEDHSILSALIYQYSFLALIVFIVKIGDWCMRLHVLLRRRLPKYDRFCELRTQSINARGRAVKTVYFTLRALTILCAVAKVLEGDFGNFALCLLTLLLFTLPDIIQQNFAIHLPTTLEMIIYCFIFAAEVLGEINNFYGAIPGWDTMLHTLNGFLCAAIGFAMVDMLNRNSKNIRLSPLYLAIMAFCFSMTIGVVWEFIEFFGDQFFAVDMQKDTVVPLVKSILINPRGENVPVFLTGITDTVIHYGDGETFVVNGGYLDIGIVDTMKDLLVNFLGAIVFSVFGYFYVKDRDSEKKKSFAGQFIPVVNRE